MNKYRNKIASVLLATLALTIGGSACSDDHYDVKSSGANAQSVWENMQNDTDLDSLRLILSRAVVMSSDRDAKSKATYATLLNSSQAVTVWAPVDGTYPAYYYLSLLDRADSLANIGQTTEALKLRYTVGDEFVKNHIARYNYSRIETLDQERRGKEVNLLNGKAVRFSRSANTFNSVALSSGVLPSSNGVVYKLQGFSPYSHNLWTYLRANPQFSLFYEALTQPRFDTYTFSATGSTPGAMNEQGQMVYIDSVYIHNNTFLSSSTYIENEDSMLFALVPTNTGWGTAKSKAEALYNYTTKYKTDYVATEDNTTGRFRNEVTIDVDSLKELNSILAITESMLYAPWRYGVTDYSDSAAIVRKALYADSLISVSRKILYNPDADTTAPDTKLNPFFEQPKSLLKASNGYILPLDEYRITAGYIWQDKSTVLNMADYTNNILEVDNVTSTASTGSQLTLNPTTRNEEVVGEVPNNRYRRFTPLSNAAQLRISIPLRNVMSANYRIKVMLVPNRINKDFIVRNAAGNEIVERFPIYAQIAYDTDENLPAISSVQTSTPFLVDNDSVKEYVLFDNFKFTKSYAGLPSSVNSFARLILVCPPNLNLFGAPYRGAAYARTANGSLNIVRIILEPVRE